MNEITRKSIGRSTVFNLAGYGIPFIIALVCMPILINGIGKERFGILTLISATIGYFSLFDFGLGRALTNRLSQKLSSGATKKEVGSLIGTAVICLVLVGIAGTTIGFGLANWLVFHVLNIPKELESETINSFYVLACVIPALLLSLSFRGILHAKQRFDIVNFIQVPVGTLIFLGPVLLLPYSKNLVNISYILGATIIVGLMALALAVIRILPDLLNNLSVNKTEIKYLATYGGWLTITNIVGPILVYCDRVFIGALISMTAVTYYTLPYEVVTKLWVFSSALTTVLFTTFSTTFLSDKERTSRLFVGGLKYIFIFVFPITLILICLGKEGLNFWVGSDFVINSLDVLHLLAVGVFINCFAQVAINLMWGAGQPAGPAKLHLIELMAFLVALPVMIKYMGITGAALVWLARIIIDTIALFVMAVQLLSLNKQTIFRLVLCLLASLILFEVSLLMPALKEKMIFLIITLAGFTITVWKYLLHEEDQAWFKQILNGN